MDKSIVFSFGRFNPPTRGHAILFDKVLEVSKQYKCDHLVVASNSKDKIKNPLSIDRKLFYLKEFFPDINIKSADKQFPSLVDQIITLNKHYNKLYFVCGFDRMDEYKQLILRYNHTEYTYDKIDIIECGNLNTREFYSATLLRNLVRGRDISGLLSRVKEFASDYEEMYKFIKQKETTSSDLKLFFGVCVDHPLRYKFLIELDKELNTLEVKNKV